MLNQAEISLLPQNRQPNGVFRGSANGCLETVIVLLCRISES